MKIDSLIFIGKPEAKEQTVEPSSDILQLEEVYTVGSTTRSLAKEIKVENINNKMVELVFEDHTTWLCSSDTLDEVFPEAAIQNRAAEAGTFRLPTAVRSTTEERGIVSDIALKLIKIFTKKTVQTKVSELAASLEKKQLENYSGLYRLDKTFSFQRFEPKITTQPYLLFLHGTASSTKGSFAELMSSQLWAYIHEQYGDHVLALQHETLTKSPLQNVLDLVQVLPASISFDIISHSRGGLVGDLLSRFANSDERHRGFDNNEIAYLKKESRTGDVETINKIKEALTNKKIVVNKFIRVACPASGTTLASARMDNFFNITLNLIGLGTGAAANPFYGAFKDLITGIIDSKNEVDVLPGLEAMNPESAFIKILNSPASEVVLDRPLTVISGNCRAKPNLKALLIIASKLFYLKDNDLVVNTLSMYQGTRRSQLLQYYFDSDTNVDHFHYFKNEDTNAAILNALQADGNSLIKGFTQAKQATLIAQRNALIQLDGGPVCTDTITGKRAIVVLLPGIMGSNLSQNNNLLWIDYWRFATGGLAQLAINTPDITANSLVKTSYSDLVKHLSDEYDVITFPFDWRQQLTGVADRLNNKIQELLTYKQPIKIIGHSMGGVVVRDFIVQHHDTWQTLNRTAGFKLIFLGAPLGGSFRIPAVLFGFDSIIRKLGKIDLFHTKQELLTIFSQMPGLLCLLPFTQDKENDFAKKEVWDTMRSAFGIIDWPLPAPTDLGIFEKYRNGALTVMNSIDYSNTVYIAGKDKATPCGYRIEETHGKKELVFLSTAEGDQSVTWESGIPQPMIEQNRVYYTQASHGALATDRSLFKGITELLHKGTTNMLSTLRPSVRSDQKVFRTPVPEDFDLSPEGLQQTLLGISPEEERQEYQKPLVVAVRHGELQFASFPVLVGHFKNDGITSAEAAVDKMLNGALTTRHKLNLYPGDIGTSEVLVYTEEAKGQKVKEQRWKGAIVVGLGVFGELSDTQIIKTIEQGVAKLLLHVSQQSELKNGSFVKQNTMGISTLLIGSGYGGLSLENSVRAILQGVQKANRKIQKLQWQNAMQIEQVEIIELFEDIALNCFYSVAKLAGEQSKTLPVEVNKVQFKQLLGAKKRIASEETQGWWTRITVKWQAADEATQEPAYLQFNISTGGAREEERRLYLNPAGLESLLRESTVDNSWSPQLGKILFERLIPLDFKERLKKQCNIMWILDKYTASYPWELLQDSLTESLPLCVSSGMIRQLATQDYRLHIDSVAGNTALVVAEPNLEGFLPPLPGACEEGKQVNELLAKTGFTVMPVFKSNSAAIFAALFTNDYKIIHLAGHGGFNPLWPMHSGMVIGNKEYLTTSDLKQMTSVPELVFVNCCYLGQTDGVSEEYYRARYKMAANIGVQLIENGVKAVIVAGWAVQDAAALTFARTFYQCLFNDYTFGTAVQEARKRTYEQHQPDNTWGAYQAYGDPFYKLRNTTHSSKPYAPTFVIAEEAAIALQNLQNELKTGKATHEENIEKLMAISQAVDTAGIRNGVITELEALTYADMYEYDNAILKFESLLAIENASFSVATLEKYCNVRMKKYAFDFITHAIKPAEKDVKGALNGLQNLLSISPTAERYSLLGSAYKRKALLSASAGGKLKAYASAAYYYYKGNSMPQNTNKAYTIANWYALEHLLVLANEHQWNSEIAVNKDETYWLPALDTAKEELVRLYNATGDNSAQMNYWQLMKKANLLLCLFILCNGDNEKVITLLNDDAKEIKLLDAYADVWKTAGSKGDHFAEVEHVEILLDAALMSKKEAARLKTALENLLSGLKQMGL